MCILKYFKYQKLINSRLTNLTKEKLVLYGFYKLRAIKAVCITNSDTCCRKTFKEVGGS